MHFPTPPLLRNQKLTEFFSEKIEMQCPKEVSVPSSGLARSFLPVGCSVAFPPDRCAFHVTSNEFSSLSPLASTLASPVPSSRRSSATPPPPSSLGGEVHFAGWWWDRLAYRRRFFHRYKWAAALEFLLWSETRRANEHKKREGQEDN